MYSHRLDPRKRHSTPTPIFFNVARLAGLLLPVSHVSRPAAWWLPARLTSHWRACEAGGLPGAYAAQGVHARRCCGKRVFDFPIRGAYLSMRTCWPLFRPIMVIWLRCAEQSSRRLPLGILSMFGINETIAKLPGCIHPARASCKAWIV